ncbi:hypothetical protein [Corynebacterium ureicelerivorans]|uniref:hypothetical protein n=1 Tax=Corynebacterium ureicelerivorans TaxID=401472 RepID=UPI00264F179D|nr:hypothetical protein [Corynebacterium ureicelerivorans]MDN8627136.1 hypothetical protein [Corynebacterium ureicelerivorans]
MFNLIFDLDVTNDAGDQYPFIIRWDEEMLFGLTDAKQAADALAFANGVIDDAIDYRSESERAEMRSAVTLLFEGSAAETIEAAKTIADCAIGARWQFGYQRVREIAA